MPRWTACPERCYGGCLACNWLGVVPAEDNTGQGAHKPEKDKRKEEPKRKRKWW